MDKETLSNYGLLTVVTLILAVMLAFATPFGTYVGDGVVSVANGFVGASDKGLDEDNISGLEKQWGDKLNTGTRNSVIPDGATYYKGGELCGRCRCVYGIQGMKHGPMTDNGMTPFTKSPTATYTSGQTFPATVEIGDIYVEDDFRYSYFSDGWHVSVLENKAQYDGTILSEINGKKITSMLCTFASCTSLTTAPTIPNSITNMSNTFSGCRSLTTAPAIPNGVTDMSYTFGGCAKLTTAPAIPNGVTNMNNTFASCTCLTTAPIIPNSVTSMSNTFGGCTSLVGTIEVNANPTSYINCLKSTQITSITGSCSQETKDALMSTK